MIFKKFADELAKETTFTQVDTRKFIKAFFEKLMRMPVGERVNFETYGVFHSKRLRPRVAYSSLIGKTVNIRAKKFLHFKQSKNVDLSFDELHNK